jgi:hypothetical protein
MGVEVKAKKEAIADIFPTNKHKEHLYGDDSREGTTS